MNTHPLSWLKQIQEELSFSHKIPLWGAPPTFPWEHFSRELETSLDIPGITAEVHKSALLSPDEFLLNLGKKPVIKTLELSPLSGTVHFIIAHESLEKVSSLALSPQESPVSKGFSDPQLQEGFFEYLLLAASDSLSRIGSYPDLQIHWLETKPLPHSSSLSCDLSLKMHGQTFLARLLFSPAFHEAFSEHFKSDLPNLFASPLLDTVKVALKVETGSCLLSKSAWDKLLVGDFLILDTCSYDPQLRKGTLNLTLGKTPLFKVKIKKDGLKILDYCTYYGDTMTMDEDSDLDSIFPDEESLEHTDETSAPAKEMLSSSLEISFPIVVEIDRISMPLKKILNLAPGNIVELPMHPEQGVYLTVHGKKIAKGELIKLGDAIGVKIAEIG